MTEQAFWDAMIPEPNTGCWLWTRGLDSRGGYGRVIVDKQRWRVHVLAWTLTNGPVTKGLCVCHKCDTRACGNPAHLFLGTPTENAIDAHLKGRLVNGANYVRRPVLPRIATPRGESHYNARLTVDQVMAIKGSTEGSSMLARRYGVSHTTIYSIRAGRKWRHVTLESEA